MKIKIKISKVFTMFIALLPILSLYSSILPGISLSEMILLIFMMYSIFDNKRKKKIDGNIYCLVIIFIVYSLLISCINILMNTDEIFNIFSRSVRFVFYIICIIHLVSKYLNPELFMRYTMNVSYTCFYFILLQYFSYHVFGKELKGYFPNLGSVNMMDPQKVNFYIFRPSAFFSEPAMLVWYILPVLIICIFKFDKSKKFKSIIPALVMTSTIILSKSLYGLLTTSIIWMAFILYSLFLKKKKNIYTLFLIFLAPFIANSVFKSSVVTDALQRINFDDISGSASFSGRFLQYDLYNSSSTLKKIFGNGVGNIGDSFVSNSVAYLLVGVGIVGVSIIIMIILYGFYRTKMYESKMWIICLIVIAFGSNSIIYSDMIYFAAFFWVYEKQRQINNKGV